MGNQNRKPSDEDDQSKYPFGHHAPPTTCIPQTRVARVARAVSNPQVKTPTTVASARIPSRSVAKEQHAKPRTPNTRVFDPTSPIAFTRKKLQRDRDICNPFVTEIITYETPKSTTQNDDIKSNDTPSAQPDNTDTSTASFEFGELFGYWQSDSPTTTYVAPQYKSLKDEITNPNNEVYVSSEMYETEFIPKANQLYHEMYEDDDSECAIYAKNKPYFNKLFGIKPGAKMDIDHILAVVLYTNTNELQKYLKQQTRKMHYNEGKETVATRNSKYAHWFRLLFEVIWLFGDDLKYNQRVYHGINCKLLFNKFEYNFNTPLSTTIDDAVALSFCKDKGIVLELRNAESHPQSYFSVQRFSQYSESEYLFFGATLRISSILVPDALQYRTYTKEIDVLNFYLNLITGREIERFKETLGKLCGYTLKLIEKHMALLRGEDTSDMDGYIWDLFINFTKTNAIIWINKNEMRYLKYQIKAKNDANRALVKHLVDVDDNETCRVGEYVTLLQLQVRYAVEYEWIVPEDELQQLRNGLITNKNGVVCQDYWDYYIDEDKCKRCTFGANMVVGFYDEDTKENEMKQVGFYWRLSDLPQEFKSVMVSLEIYCPQIPFYIQFFNIKMTRSKDPKDGVQSTGHTNLFALSKLEGLDTFKWRVIMKCWPVKQ